MLRCILFGHQASIRVTDYGREAICIRCGKIATYGSPDFPLDEFYP